MGDGAVQKVISIRGIRRGRGKNQKKQSIKRGRMGDKRTGVVFPCLNAYNPQSQIRKVKIFQIKKRRKKEKKMARNEKFLRLGIMD